MARNQVARPMRIKAGVCIATFTQTGGLAKLSVVKQRCVKIRIFVSAELERLISGRVHPNAARADSWRRPRRPSLLEFLDQGRTE